MLMLILFWLSQTIAVTLRIQEVFSGCTVPLDSKDTKFGNSQQEVSPSAGENTRKVLKPYRTWECVHTVISGGVDISEVAGCYL